MIRILNEREGRTTRMLKDALKTAYLGKSSIVVAENQTQMVDISKMLLELAPKLENSCVRAWGEFGKGKIIIIAYPEIKDTILGIRDYEMFLDHYVIESRFSWILDQWIKYATEEIE